MFKKTHVVIALLAVTVAVLIAGFPLGAQVEWPEGCAVPALEETLNPASDAQGEGDVTAFVNALNEANRLLDETLQRCLEDAVSNEADLQGASLMFANLEEAFLNGANLQMANLGGANLRRAVLWGADLQGADLPGANLEGAYLESANLQMASMFLANLRGANLLWANLEGAYLDGIDLRGADLSGANLQYANLTAAIFDTETILPDGTYWTPDSDWGRFASPGLPDFWRSDDPASPAYGGD